MDSNDDEIVQYIKSFIYDQKKKNSEIRGIQKQINKQNGIKTTRKDWRNKRGLCKWFIDHKHFTFPYLKHLEKNDTRSAQERSIDVQIVGDIFSTWTEDCSTNCDDGAELNDSDFIFSSAIELDIDFD